MILTMMFRSRWLAATCVASLAVCQWSAQKKEVLKLSRTVQMASESLNCSHGAQRLLQNKEDSHRRLRRCSGLVCERGGRHTKSSCGDINEG